MADLSPWSGKESRGLFSKREKYFLEDPDTAKIERPKSLRNEKWRPNKKVFEKTEEKPVYEFKNFKDWEKHAGKGHS